jgi:two-component system CheB/CheR fusion protein
MSLRTRSFAPSAAPVETSRVEQLDQELESTRQELESTIHELNASNQELTALNEEAVSLNEEFQSTNEELETSKEELQSLNEELTSANSQLQESLEQQRNTSTDLKNILDSSQIATLLLDRDLKIRFCSRPLPLRSSISLLPIWDDRWRISPSVSSISI